MASADTEGGEARRFLALEVLPTRVKGLVPLEYLVMAKII